ncbi:serine/threonine-protein kinase Gin4p [[Candida] railenensis]|uniref:non-specific serine/threonine protein kinase n=1 Tax=[Candida] railenensis TaxID=45579 RepID=A0A9P0VYY1_9ASCO|nr:serine/threonine-protein kinase Gin4p [[Candida] railenensis]
MSYHSRQPSVASSLLSSSTNHTHPQRIGPWKLGKTLGRGATGRVLLATHHITGQKAAVKVVSKSELADEGAPPRKTNDNEPQGLPYGIEREIIIMKLLTHPNVLRLYDVWETSKALYLVLEYVEGGELFDLLVERGPLQEIEAIKYFRQIILGTAYCHALGICHRDLKPENLLLDSSLNVKLADFGMAALESNGKLLETSCGSPHYAAPEIVSGLKYHGAASDVWSCGVILFALLTGRLPFDDEHIRNLLLKVQAGTFEMAEELSPEAKNLISKMLTVDPMKRIPTEKILSHPLLTKYPIPNEDLISVKSLPHPETAYKSLGSIKNIDKQILQNLSILWHDRSQDDIINCLLKNGANPEKTFYALLMRYRHNQEDMAFNDQNSQQNSPIKKSGSRRNLSRSGSLGNGRNRPISVSNSRNRISYQYKNEIRTSTVVNNGPIGSGAGRLSASSSFQNSPFKNNINTSPNRRGSPQRFSYSQSPARSPNRRSPNRRSPKKINSSNNNRFEDSNVNAPAIPRNIYNEIVNAQNNGSFGSMPPSLPSKDEVQKFNMENNINVNENGEPNPIVDEVSSQLGESANLSPSKNGNKRNSIMTKSASKNRLSKRKSMRASMTTGLKRNSITMKLLSTYAKLAGETDWEYMDKQTKRTSATFATLCDKIFNQETYTAEDEQLIDEEEKQAREYERIMELERKKHEAEIKARKELAKQRKRQKRKSLLSSRKLSIFIKDENNTEQDITVEPEAITQPKRGSKLHGLRAISEGGAIVEEDNENLNAADIEMLKRRSATQPVPRRRVTPVLTRRPVSRLDPLWTAYENEELNRAKDALEAEYRDAKESAKQKQAKKNKEAKQKQQQNNNRQSMVSVDFDNRRYAKDEYYTHEVDYELPEPDVDQGNLSAEYMSEIRKSKLLNSQLNIHGILENGDKGKQKSKAQEQQTLIGNVKIPNVTRKSRNFTNSNKRLSVLTMYSTKESYQDLSSILKDEGKNSKLGLRTSFADRLDKAGLPEEENEGDEIADDDVMDFDDLATRRASYYANSRRYSKYNGNSKSANGQNKNRPISELPRLPNNKSSRDKDAEYDNLDVVEDYADNADDTFADDPHGGVYDDEELDSELFDNIKLPEHSSSVKKSEKAKNNEASRNSKLKQQHVSSMLPDSGKDNGKNGPGRRAPPAGQQAQSEPYPKVRKPKNGTETIPPTPFNKKPLEDSTNKPSTGSGTSQDQNKKKGNSIFRKLSWGTKKSYDENTQLPSPADSRAPSAEVGTRKPSNSFFRWLSGNNDSENVEAEIRKFKTILPKQEMTTALFALLNSWTNFGLKGLKNDTVGYNITGGISSYNAFNLKSCKFRIKINSTDFNQKSEIVCARVKGSKVTTDTLFKEIEKVLRKEGVMDS